MTQPPSHNSLVSVRVPKSLYLELKEMTSRRHFMDISEHVRGIVRSRWQEAAAEKKTGIKSY